MEVWGYSPLLGMKLNPLLNTLNELEDVLQAGALQDLAKSCTCSVYSVDLDTVITRKGIKQMSNFLV